MSTNGGTAGAGRVVGFYGQPAGNGYYAGAYGTVVYGGGGGGGVKPETFNSGPPQGQQRGQQGGQQGGQQAAQSNGQPYYGGYYNPYR